MANLSVLASVAVLCATVAVARLISKATARFGVPPLLLELLAGFIIGNTLFPYSSLSGTQGLTELGIAALFFLVGLHLDLRTLSTHRADVLRTVTLSSCVPFLFLPLCIWIFGSTPKALFVLAVIMATGTGVALRILESLGASRTPSAHVLVSVSVLDEVPAVLTLVLATHLISNPEISSVLNFTHSIASQSATLWPVLALAAGGPAVAMGLKRAAKRGLLSSQLPPSAFVLVTVLVLAAWAGEATGFTPLFGALCAGVVVRRFVPESAPVEANLRFASEVLVPLFFVTVGMRMSAESLASPRSWALAALFSAIAVFVKLVCVFGIGKNARAQGIDPWTVAFGLMPRGLPGLVFASSALSLGAISEVEFSSLVLMVAFTTATGLVLLARRVRQTMTRRESSAPVTKGPLAPQSEIP